MISGGSFTIAFILILKNLDLPTWRFPPKYLAILSFVPIFVIYVDYLLAISF